MNHLGYERYGVQGGDIGAGICGQLCVLAPDRIIGSLINTDPGAIAGPFTPPTDHLSVDENEQAWNEIVLFSFQACPQLPALGL